MAGRTLAEVYVSVRGDTGQLSGDIRQGVRRVDTKAEGAKAGHSYGSAFGSSAKRVIGGIGALVAAAGVGQIIKESVSGFRDHQKVVAQTNAVLKSTKNAANTSVGAIGKLSDALERKSTVDGDVIQSGANMLATFTNVQNRVGKGNDIFNRATATVLDMSVALGQDAPSSAIQLGKALNDPVKGITALQRVGVTFTKGQRDQIDAMVKAGNVAGAQKVILNELNKEFGGSAAAQGKALGAQGRLTVAWRQAQDTIGAALLPVVNELEGALADRLPGAADKFAAAVKTGDVQVRSFIAGLSGQGPIDGFSGKLNTLGLGVRALIAAYKEGDVTSDGFVGKMEKIGVALGRVRDYLKNVDFKSFSGDAKDAGSSLAKVDVKGFATQLQSVDTSHLGDGLTVFGKGLGFVADHIDLIIKAMPALLVAYGGYKAAEAAGNVAALASIPIKVAQVASNFALSKSLKSLAAGQVEVAVATGGATASEAVKTAVIGAGTAATGRGTVATLASAVAQRTVAAATKVWAATQWLINAALTANPIGLVITAIALLAGGIIYAYKHSETFRKIVQGAFQGVQVAASFMWNNVLKPIFRFIVGAWLAVAGAIINGAAKAFGWVPGIGGKLKAAASAFNTFRDQVNRSLDGTTKPRKITITAEMQSHSIDLGGGRRAASRVALATGGPVFGAGTATSDSIPAMLSNGEHVLTAREVQAFGGHGAVMQMRKSVVRGFAAGGPVGLQISPQLTGMARFERAVEAFSDRATAVAQKIAIASSGFSANLAGVVAFARSQAGKPYIWGAAGPGGYDCSGFVSALVNVAQGRRPYSRRFSTGTLPAGLFAPGNGAFNIGWFTGNPGHVAATVNGVPMESRGGDGVVVGAGSRGASQGFFNRHGHLIGFARGGPVLPGDPPFDVLDPRGKHYQRGLMEQLQQATRVFDDGGILPPRSTGVWRNNTYRAETVTTGQTMDALIAEQRKTNHLLASLPIAQVDDRYVRRANRYMNNRDPSGW